MTSETILADRLKSVRKARKIGRPKLAKLSGLTERQLAKLETKGAAVPEPVLSNLAEALHITPLALTGALPLIDEDLQPAASTCTSGCCG
ncbi:helix-turn-helix domain-containing protein [Octadecabacter sp. CECT 8868]|uniref:helix-turn-helix domain-containing protein n=1 Tax=Octadecabacter algicola TaxID=2909342 RepID=UPI001F18CEBC|nr:helix-turn-helix transcriptional regulator [Octadecabacter algicola]MCF2904073.1 helix-turn-helix domain-containing protein [Octadecabacter algicola]